MYTDKFSEIRNLSQPSKIKEVYWINKVKDVTHRIGKK